jgi:hypothetical protein
VVSALSAVVRASATSTVRLRRRGGTAGVPQQIEGGGTAARHRRGIHRSARSLRPDARARRSASATGASLMATDDAKPCGWCRSVMTTTNPRARFCGRKCRQAAFRLRRRSCRSRDSDAAPGIFIYADPPYPGTSAKYYRDEPTFAGEVDYPALIASLRAAHDKGECFGWALSTSARSLRELLPLCPPEARVCPWVKPIGVSSRTYGLHNTWEPLIVVGGRQRRPGKRDLVARDAGPERGHIARPEAGRVLRLAVRGARHAAGRYVDRCVSGNGDRLARLGGTVVQICRDSVARRRGDGGVVRRRRDAPRVSDGHFGRSATVAARGNDRPRRSGRRRPTVPPPFFLTIRARSTTHARHWCRV